MHKVASELTYAFLHLLISTSHQSSLFLALFALLLFTFLLAMILELTRTLGWEEPCHVFSVWSLVILKEIVSLEILDVVIFKVAQRVVIGLQLVNIKFHSRRPFGPFLVQLSPATWCILFLDREQELANRFFLERH